MLKAATFNLPEPPFNSRITDLIMDIDYLRRKETQATIDPFILNQLRNIFRDLDSMHSARVDGNMTGLSKYLESKEDNPEAKGRKIVEIDKTSGAMRMIEENIGELAIFQGFFTELHKNIREGITQESSRFAGKYRQQPARPDQPANTSPAYHLVETFIDRLVAFINKKENRRNEPLKIAWAHQRYLWIHPYREANGLTGRLLTFTMLKKMGFDGDSDRIINPSFSFCWDPDKYLKLVKKADSEKEKDVFTYLEYVLEGLRNDMEKMDSLLNYDLVRENILKPSFRHPIFERLFSDQDRLILDVAMEKQIFQAADIRVLFPLKPPTEISKMIKWLRDKELIIGIDENARKYSINLENKYLVKMVVGKLERGGFIPAP